jgi:hypothetical protein
MDRSNGRLCPPTLVIGAAFAAMALGTAAHAQSTGVAACDDFLAKYDACMTSLSSKAPVFAAQREAIKSQMDMTRKQWTEYAKNPATKSTLEGLCKQSAEQIKLAFQAFGCSF